MAIMLTVTMQQVEYKEIFKKEGKYADKTNKTASARWTAPV